MDQPTVGSRAGESRLAEARAAFASRPDAQEDSYEAAMRAADALFAARQPAPARTETTDEPSADAPHASGGRVLRVLDEAPSPEMLRLEAEHAPKRRGRKPGSKNKPKPAAPAATLAAIEAWPDEDDVAPAPADTALPPIAVPARSGAVALVAARPAAVAVPRAGDKYAWVRTKLKPGQQWKRRLPKVAW